MPRERPILFSSAMVRAILAGQKTQTRRVLIHDAAEGVAVTSPGWEHANDTTWIGCDDEGTTIFSRCPYGQPGDRLVVREEHYRFGHWEPVPGVRTKRGRQKWRFVADTAEVLFDAPASFRKGRHHKDSATPGWHKRLARFMPLSFARIRLEVTEVRVQLLQEISEADARMEGVETFLHGGYDFEHYSLRPPEITNFRRLWDSINSERPGASWDSKPWVYAITFRVSEQTARRAA